MPEGPPASRGEGPVEPVSVVLPCVAFELPEAPGSLGGSAGCVPVAVGLAGGAGLPAGAPSDAKSSAASVLRRVLEQSPVPKPPLLSRHAYTRYVSPAANRYPHDAELALVAIAT
jgi:hypothetical protein